MGPVSDSIPTTKDKQTREGSGQGRRQQQRKTRKFFHPGRRGVQRRLMVERRTQRQRRKVISRERKRNKRQIQVYLKWLGIVTQKFRSERRLGDFRKKRSPEDKEPDP